MAKELWTRWLLGEASKWDQLPKQCNYRGWSALLHPSVGIQHYGVAFLQVGHAAAGMRIIICCSSHTAHLRAIAAQPSRFHLDRGLQTWQSCYGGRIDLR